MISVNKEFYSSPYFFLLKENQENYSLIFSVGETLSEVKSKRQKIEFDKNKVGKVKNYINKVVKDKKIKTPQVVKKNLEELVDDDGTIMTSRIPILDPRLHPRKTMDQTVSAARITNDPITRGYRTYYGESVEPEMKETDMSKVFGYDETQNMSGPRAYKYYIEKFKLDPPDAEERVRQQGKDPFKRKRKITISEIQKQKMIKMVEDILVNKKNSDDSDIAKKDNPKNIEELPILVKKNLKNLLKHAESNGFTKDDIIKLIKKGE